LEYEQEAQVLAWTVTILRRNRVQNLVEASFQVKRLEYGQEAQVLAWTFTLLRRNGVQRLPSR
jgi:hypothetical protein